MKTHPFLSLFAAAVLTAATPVQSQARHTEPTATASAVPFDVSIVRAPAEMKLRVFIQKHQSSSLSVSLRNSQGELLYSSTVGKKEPGRALSFNLSELPDGTYTLDVKGAGKHVTKTLNLDTPQRLLAMN